MKELIIDDFYADVRKLAKEAKEKDKEKKREKKQDHKKAVG